MTASGYETKFAAPPGYDRKTGRYRWMFPPEMRIVRLDLRAAVDGPDAFQHVAGSGTQYCAEGALSPDGRHLVYSSVESGQGDIFVKDLSTGRTVAVVQEKGYDGGPFFSPDGKKLMWTTTRATPHLGQLFIADFKLPE